jgi:hypothetical protein
LDFTVVQIIAGIAIQGMYGLFLRALRAERCLLQDARAAPVDATITIGVFVWYFSSGHVSARFNFSGFAVPTVMFLRENYFHVDITGYNTLVYFTLIVAVFLTYNHRANIKRLLYGEESRFEGWWKIRLIKIKAPFKRKWHRKEK